MALLVLFGSLHARGQAYNELLKAVNGGDVKTVADFLDKGLDPNTTDREGFTLLMTASRLGHLELVKLLIARKASVTRQSAQGDTALMLASLKGHRAVGGMRASIYNAFPEEGVDALVSFMQEFERTKG